MTPILTLPHGDALTLIHILTLILTCTHNYMTHDAIHANTLTMTTMLTFTYNGILTVTLTMMLTLAFTLAHIQTEHSH